MKKYRSKKWLHNQYIKKDKRMSDIASCTEVTTRTISRWLNRYDIEKDYGKSHYGEEKYKDKEWLRDQYFTEKRSIQSTANECDVDKDTIYNWLEKKNIIINPQKIIDNKKLCSRCRNWKGLNEFYQDNIKETGLTNYCKECGFPYPKRDGQYLYMIRMGKYTKVGRTNNVKNRMNAIWNANPYNIKAHVFKKYDNKKDVKNIERKIHDILSKYHKRGEWFKLATENKDFIQSNLPIKVPDDLFVTN